MKILVYGINYTPELTGIGKYTGEMCAWLASRGHRVEVITAMPYYPQWKVNSKYRGKWWFTEMIDKVKVHRCPLYVPAKVSGSTRIVHEISFMVSSTLFWMSNFFKKYDCVIAICPPLLSGIFPRLYNIVWKKPFIYHIQDLQLDAAKELGLIKNRFFLKILELIESHLVNNANTVSSISAGMKNNILKKGVKESAYFSLPNWVDTDFIKPVDKNNPLKKRLGFAEEDKIVLYSGNIGEKQGLELLIEVAENFKDQPEVFFVFVGEGAYKAKLIEVVTEKNLKNVKFFSLQPYEDLPYLLGLADVHLVLQKKVASDLVLPSKLMSVLSAGGLAIVSATENTTLYNLITNEKMGIIVEPENSTALSKAIEGALFANNETLKANARSFALRDLHIDHILGKLEEFLQKKH
ncbi:MAG TPA: WcaI family glycosyltransferase [Cytophagaceae bacterium]|jgi:colanic acid biosynthesis glycosyl transferase WcaI